MNAAQAARYDRVSQLTNEFDQPNGIFALAEAIVTIETALTENQDHFVQTAFIEVILTLVNRRLFIDVAQALVLQLLSIVRDRSSLLTASRVAEWSGNPSLATELNSEAATAPDRLQVRNLP